jgi:hypothetical protein
MKETTRKRNIFANKSSYILRTILHEPDRKWIIRDFIGPGGVSLGLAQAVLSEMEKQGYVEWTKKGPNSFIVLTEKQKIISDWMQAYDFSFNDTDTYYNPDKKLLEKFKDMLDPARYALTLHTGANLFTSFVKTDDIYVYLNLKSWEEELLALRQRLDLKELVRGGNIHVIKP